jgi:hypothetical protein
MHHESQLITSSHHVRIPVHFMDGILIHETEDDNAGTETAHKRTLGEQEEEDFEDRYVHGNPRYYMIATLDRKNNFSLWDLMTCERKVHQKHPITRANLIFISKNYMYAGEARLYQW